MSGCHLQTIVQKHSALIRFSAHPKQQQQLEI